MKKKSCIVLFRKEKIPWDTRIGRENLLGAGNSSEWLTLGLLLLLNFDLCESICACHHAAEGL
jgi:hypothetical protein